MKITERALLARINRALKKEGERLKRCRKTSRDYLRLGDYYLVDLPSNGIARIHVDLIEMATEVGVVKGGDAL